MNTQTTPQPKPNSRQGRSVSFYAPEPVYQAVVRYCADRGLPRYAALRRLIQSGLIAEGYTVDGDAISLEEELDRR